MFRRLRFWQHCRHVALMLALAVAATLPATAHDVPDVVPITVHAKAEADRLDLLIRVPLLLLLDIGVPQRGPGFLELNRMGPVIERAVIATARSIQVTGDGRPLAVTDSAARISLPAEQTFGSFETALAHIQGPPLPEETNVFWNQGFLDVHLVYPTAASGFGLQMDLVSGLGAALRYEIAFVAEDGEVRRFAFRGQVPDLRLDPTTLQVAGQFAQLGIFHLATTWEALVLLACLVLPLTRRLDALPVAGTFAAGVVLGAVALAGGAGTAANDPWLAALAGTLAALLLLYLALENVLARDFGHRWALAIVAGVVAGVLLARRFVDLAQFATIHVPAGLAAFAAGAVLAMGLVLFLVLGLRHLAYRSPILARHGVLIVSLFVGHESWHALQERVAVLQALSLPVLHLGTAYAVFVLALTLVFGALLAWVVLSPSVRRAWHRLRSDDARL